MPARWWSTHAPNDSPLLGPTLHAAMDRVGPLPDAVNVNLVDRGYDSNASRALLRELGFISEIALHSL
ncbi:hypothetical protein GCM10010448_70840 [Streptomyces glomeratus]|uniref:Transposase n=1 Tax=Streptomyces glomeratus TaxID=284452 RepID=A0ABP6M772_9ACTN